MKKIMFNDRYGLTKAVLEGRKTMTRRIVSDKMKEVAGTYRLSYYADTLDALSFEDALLEFSPLKVGEVVAVAQSYGDIFRGMTSADYMDERFNPLLSKGPHLENEAGWTNKMFVKADLMPHRIRITGVRVERLQDISDEDCLCEGVKLYADKYGSWGYTFTQSIGVQLFTSPREAFAALIDKVSGKGTWKSNPWVFVYEFELLK